MEQTEQVEVKLLNYTLLFKRMRWLDDAAIEFLEGKDPRRLMLAHALVDAASFKPKNWEEGLRVMEAIPSAIIDRVFRIWRGSFPPARKFTTSKLYLAPEPTTYESQIDSNEKEEDIVHTRMVREMESKFGLDEVAETKELDQKILAAARKRGGGYRGATPVSEEEPYGQ